MTTGLQSPARARHRTTTSQERLMPLIPWHWAMRGPGKARTAADIFPVTTVRGGHASTLRRLLRIGPWGIYVIRYRPGDGPEPTMERIP